MKAGGYIQFPAGQSVAGHCSLNPGDAPARYVIIGERNLNEVVVYTDSNKVLVRGAGLDALLDLTAARNYWDGEDTGLADATFASATSSAIWRGTPVKALAPVSVDEIAWDESRAGSQFGGHPST